MKLKFLFRLCLAGVLFTHATQFANAETIPKVGEKATDFSLNTLTGDKVKLSALLESGPVVVVVLRGYPGYQCPLCTRQVGELIRNAKGFQQANAQVVMIYPGPKDQLSDKAKDFIGQTQLPEHFKLVTDPDYRFTNAWSLRWDAPRETAYPSVFVVGTHGKVQFSHVSEGHGNRAKTADVLKAIQ